MDNGHSSNGSNKSPLPYVMVPLSNGSSSGNSSSSSNGSAQTGTAGSSNSNLVPRRRIANTSMPVPAVIDAEVTDLTYDVDFKWAQDSYNETERNVDTWSFFTIFRAWSFFLDKKWSYIGEQTMHFAG